ncbi:MAG TPA: hypothetical protein VHC44_14275 [Verrucomicrobiae bacterium]|nr:hypothetical protein [Verrucomicrobiae bacterium]
MRKVSHILLLVLLFCAKALGQTVFTREIDATFDWSSYGNPYFFGSVTFEAYFHATYPQWTNHILNVGNSGTATEYQYKTIQEKRCLAWWALSQGTNLDCVLAQDNGGYDFNTETNWTLQLFGAPPLFWNGVSGTTNYGISFAVKHYAVGSIPGQTPGGDGGSIARNAASMAVAAIMGTPQVDLWHMMYTNGLLTLDSDFFPPPAATGHPKCPGNTAIALLQIYLLGFETNFGSITIDAQSQTATTNHFAATGISASSTTVTATVRADRMPPGWEVPDGNLRTNDARPMFTEFPGLASLFSWKFAVTNLSAGTWQCYVDGSLVDTATSAQWAAGRNWFTNYAGPYWAQRTLLNDKVKDGAGVDHYAMLPTHDAGSGGVLPHGDLINYLSHANQGYDSDNLRGTALRDFMAPSVVDMYAYDQAKHDAAQQTPHTFTWVKVSTGTVNVNNLNVGTTTLL